MVETRYLVLNDNSLTRSLFLNFGPVEVLFLIAPLGMLSPGSF